jgi:hypothetical protein
MSNPFIIAGPYAEVDQILTDALNHKGKREHAEAAALLVRATSILESMAATDPCSETLERLADARDFSVRNERQPQLQIAA